MQTTYQCFFIFPTPKAKMTEAQFLFYPMEKQEAGLVEVTNSILISFVAAGKKLKTGDHVTDLASCVMCCWYTKANQ